MVGAMGQATAAATKFQAQMSGVAKVSNFALARLVPIGAAAAGYALAKFAKASFDAAVEYNASMTKIAALTDVSTQRVGHLSDTILDLSSQTATAPVELAHSMYFLASAGLNTNQQMETLEATARGAAVGLGDAGDLAKVSANALNTFADNGLQAADVMDTLVAAVREGTAEPDEFASALGRVLPIADQAGLSFQQVAASLATMSNAGLNVNLGVTSLRALLQSLIAPTNQTRDAFQSVGLTADDVVQSMSQNGLIDTLRTLKDLAEKNTSSQGDFNILMRNMIPNIRGLTGAFNLTGQQAKQVDKIFDQVAHSTGDLDTAFEITAQSSAFKIKQAMVDIGRVGMEIASAVLPIVSAALTGLAKIFETVGKPAAFVLGVFLGFNALAAVFQVVAGAATTFTIAMQFVAATLTEIFATNPMLISVGIALGVIGAAMLVLSGNSKGAAIAVGALAIEILYLSGVLTQAQASMGAFGLAAYAVYEALKAVQGLGKQTSAAAQGFSNDLLKQTGSLDAARARVESGIGAAPSVWKPWELIGGLIDGTTLSWDAYNQAAQQVTDTIRTQNQQILDGTPIYGVYGAALDSTANTNKKLHETLAATIRDYYLQNNGLEGLNMTAVAAAAAQGNLHKAINMVKGDLGGIPEALKDVSTSLTGSEKGADGFRASLTAIASTANLTSRALVERLQAASTDGKQAVQTFIDDTIDGISTWKDTIATNVTGVSDVLTELAGKSHLSASQIHEAFTQAAQDAKDFTADLITISKVGGGAGKQLASSLLAMGPSAAGMANTIAGAGESSRKQLVGDFNSILTAGKKAADKLQTALIGTLKDIRHLLSALARHWGIDIATPGAEKGKNAVKGLHDQLKKVTGHTWEVHVEAHNGGRGITSHLLESSADIAKDINKNVNIGVKDDATPVLTSVNNYRLDPKSVKVSAPPNAALNQLAQIKNYDIPDKYITVHIHSKADSPWPDEAIDQRLVRPMKTVGFRKNANSWSVPLTVAMHTDSSDLMSPVSPDSPNSPQNRNRSRVNTGQLARLINIEKSSHDLLAQINKNIMKLHSASGGGNGPHGSSGDGSGGGGGGGGTGGKGSAGTQAHDDAQNTNKALDELKNQITKFIVQSGQTKGEAAGVMKRILQPGFNPTIIAQSFRDVQAELGNKQANLYRQLLEALDRLTRSSSKSPSVDKVKDQLARINHNLGASGRIAALLYKGGLTSKEVGGVARRVAAAGDQRSFINNLIDKMRGEMKPAELAQLRTALQHLDATTRGDKQSRQKAIKDAIEAMHRLTDTVNHHAQKLGPGEIPAWAELALKKPSKLPFGHTNIDPNEHNPRHTRNPRDRIALRLDRKHFVDQEAYHIDYSRGY